MIPSVLTILFFISFTIFTFFIHHPSDVYIGFNKKISVVILNYKRPYNVLKQIETIHDYDVIDEIIMCNGDRNNLVNYNSQKYCKIKEVFHNNLIGSCIRWFAALNCVNEYILFLDDDVLPTENSVNNLTNRIVEDPINIYGPIRRNCSKSGYHTNVFYRIFKYNMILTPILMTSKKVIYNFHSHIHKYEKLMIKNKGNCEDLLFNYIFIKTYGKRPTYVHTQYTELDTTSHSYSGNIDHYKVRTNFCKNISYL